jgi:hypothetical protein
MKNLVFILMIICCVGCSMERDWNEHRFSNTYYIFDQSNMDSIFMFRAHNRHSTLYTKKGKLNFDEFVPMENNIIRIENDTIEFRGQADALFYDGEVSPTSEQQWIHDGDVHRLPITNHTKIHSQDGFHTLSTSIKNY